MIIFSDEIKNSFFNFLKTKKPILHFFRSIALAAELGTIKKTITYPSTIILNTVFEIEAQLAGLYNAREMIGILTTYND